MSSAYLRGKRYVPRDRQLVPNLECLEDRCVLTVIVTTADGTNAENLSGVLISDHNDLTESRDSRNLFASEGWHNAELPLDTTGDGRITPRDFLFVFRAINDGGARELTAENAPDGFPDTNNDGYLTGRDGLAIIKYLNDGQGEGDALVQVRLAVTGRDDLSELGVLDVNQDFYLRVFGTDLSPETEGIFSLYTDVEYTIELADADGAIDFSADFRDGTSGDVSIDGLLDEVGGLNQRQPLDGAAEVLILSVPMRTESLAGELTFSGNPADIQPLHEILLFRDTNSILPEEIMFVDTTVQVLAGGPTAINDQYAGIEDTPLTRNEVEGVLANDISDGLTLTAFVFSQPSNGSLSFNSDGSFTYQPNADFSGVDSFTYVVNDGVQDSNVATVELSISPVNDAPVVVDDSYQVQAGTQLEVNQEQGLLGNDADAEGSQLSVVISEIQGPDNGQLILDTDGSFTYTPNAGFDGLDSFTYVVTDGINLSPRARVSVIVGEPDVPIANDDIYSTVAGETLNVGVFSGVLQNDIDVDGEQLSAELISPPQNGSISFDPDGSFVYTPDDEFFGSDTFTYVATDGIGVSSPATVTIVVSDDNIIVRGFKFIDENGDGVQDATEGFASGVTIRLSGLDVNGELVDASRVTESDGSYEFRDLFPGEYTLQEILPDGFISTTHDGPVAMTLFSGDIVEDSRTTFGNFELVNVSGKVINDRDVSGFRNDFEPGLAEWTVLRLDSTGHVFDWTVTDVDGNYELSGIGPNDGLVAMKLVDASPSFIPNILELDQFGWIETFNPDGPVTIGSGQSIFPVNLSVTSGDDVEGLDFGKYLGVPTGTIAGFVTAVDLGDDSLVDLVVANDLADPAEQQSTITIIRNLGDQIFDSPVTLELPKHARPQSVYAGDFNGDGFTDLSVAAIGNPSAYDPNHNAVLIYFANSDGSFASSPDQVVPSCELTEFVSATGDCGGPIDIAGVEVSSFSHQLATANFRSNDVSVLSVNSAGDVEETQRISTGDTPVAVEFGFVDNDSLADLIVANYESNSVTVLYGDSSGGYDLDSSDVLEGLDGPIDVLLSDIDGDFDDDLLVANSLAGDVVVFENLSGSLVRSQTLFVSGKPVSLSSGDLDGRGLPDLAVGISGFSSIEGSVALFENNGGLFAAASEIEMPADISPQLKEHCDFERPSGASNSGQSRLNPQTVALANLDNSGRGDIAVAHHICGAAIHFNGIDQGVNPDVGPIAIDDVVDVVGSQSNVLEVLSNDSPGSQPIVITSVSDSSIGSTITISADGLRLFYTPAAGFTGTDTFSYTIASSVGSSTAQVVIDVVPDPISDLVAFRAEITNDLGQPVSEITVGSSFFLNVFVRDLRSAPEGIFAAYVDVNFNQDFASPGLVSFNPYFSFAQNPSDGVLVTLPPSDNDLGGATRETFGIPSEQLLLTIPLQANNVCTFEVTMDAPDNLPLREIVLWPNTAPDVTEDRIRFEGTSIQIVSQVAPASPFTNPHNRFDINNDGVVSPRDVLALIKLLNEGEGGSLEEVPQSEMELYADANGDNHMSPRDVLEVLEALNQESANLETPLTALAVDFLFEDDDEDNDERLTLLESLAEE